MLCVPNMHTKGNSMADLKQILTRECSDLNRHVNLGNFGQDIIPENSNHTADLGCVF